LTLSKFSSFLGSRVAVLFLAGNTGVLAGRVGLKLELEGTRLWDICAPTFCREICCFNGEGGRDGGFGLYVVVVLLKGGRGF